MEIWQAIVLGAVQGFAEFLPISSSGHLFLLQKWFGIKDNVVFYSVMLHIGTLIPVVIVFIKEILALFKKPFNKLWFLVLATIPAGIIGIVFSVFLDLDTLFFNNPWLLSLTFIFTAIELMLAQKTAKNKKMLHKINAKTSFFMGVGQAVGVLPGISRSGSTITSGYLSKVKKEDNANFTFLMSIPIIVSAVLLESVGILANASAINIDFLPLIFGILSSCVSGYISIKCMLKVIKKANFKWFSVYLVLISILNLIV